jgi:mannose-6-phosphate isomerase-like protein (cupin superfamily)
MHAHGFDVRIMVLGGEITVTRDGRSETFRAGDHCEIAADCQHTTKVGLEGVAYTVGKADRRAATGVVPVSATADAEQERSPADLGSRSPRSPRARVPTA